MAGLRWTAHELAWWIGGALRLMWRRKVLLLVWLTVVLIVDTWGGPKPAATLLVPPLGVVLLGAVWARLLPVSYRLFVAEPVWRSRVKAGLRKSWPAVMDGCGLSRRGPDGTTVVPRLGRVSWDVYGLLHVTPGLLIGQTVDEVEGLGERLRTAVGAHRLRIVPNGARTGCELACTFGDPLAVPFDTIMPDPATRPTTVPEQLVLGRTEDGTPWTWDLRVCTLTAGSSGSGKGSVMWSQMLALAPYIRAGLVEVHGIDLKGGMELGLGKAMFTRYADRPELAVILLEDALAVCEARAARMSGVSRLHTATTAEPLVLVLVDELASLTAYLTDRDLLRRAEAALGRLCSIGRAPGCFVSGFLQDPRKETIKARHLFTQTIALRLREREEVAMVLGDGAIAAGAACHKISRGSPGVGCALDESGRLVRVRAGFVSDHTIRQTAAAFPAARHDPIVVPDPNDEPAAKPRNRRPRNARPVGEDAA